MKSRFKAIRRAAESAEAATLERRLDLFDRATARQTRRERKTHKAGTAPHPAGRGWTREEIYRRGSVRVRNPFVKRSGSSPPTP